MLRLEKSLQIGQNQEIKLICCSGQLVNEQVNQGQEKPFCLKKKNLVFFHLLVFNKRYGHRNILSKKTTDQAELKFRRCAPAVSKVRIPYSASGDCSQPLSDATLALAPGALEPPPTVRQLGRTGHPWDVVPSTKVIHSDG